MTRFVPTRLIFLLIVCTILIWSAKGAVLGIDFGTSSYKVALIQNKILICENEASGRKTHSAIAFRRGERLFGSDALNAARFAPEVSFNYLLDLVGKTSLSESSVQDLLPHIFYGDKIVELNSTAVGSEEPFPYLGLQIDDETTLSVPELIAMLFTHAKKIGEKTAGSRVPDVAITVPVYFTNRERNAILDAAQIAGLNVLSLLNEPTAFALNYATDVLKRANELEPLNVLFIDDGHGALQASVVRFERYVNPKSKKNATQVTNLGSSWNRKISGRELELRLANHFIRQLKEKHGIDISDNIRARFRVLTQMKKTKEILSANKETQFVIESLTPDFDFHGKITRSEFEELASDLWAEIPKVLDDLLALSNVTVGEIDLIEMVGGGMRVPRFQEVVKEHYNRDSLDFHLNSDEGAVFGAAFYAASMSSMHRVKDIRLRDTTPWRVWLEVSELDGTDISEDEEPLSRSAALFRSKNRYSSKKTLSFHASRDFQVDMRYNISEGDQDLPQDTPLSLDHIVFHDVPQRDSFNLTDTPKVHVQFRLTPSGTISLVKAEADIVVMEEVKKLVTTTSEETDQVESSDSASLNEDDAQEDDGDNNEQEGSEGEEEENTNSEASPKPEEPEGGEDSAEDTGTSDETESADKAEEQAAEETAEPEYEYVWVEKTRTVPIRSTSATTSLPHSVRRGFVKVLAEYDEKDRVRVETASAKNDLESFIYKTKELLWDDQFVSASTEEARNALSESLTDASDWLYGDGAATVLEVYKEKKSSLVSEVAPIAFRVSELTDRPQAVHQCLSILNMTAIYFVNITQTHEVEPEEVQEIEEMVTSIASWLTGKIEAQKALELHEDPVLTSNMIRQKCEPLSKKTISLLRRKVRRPPPPPPPPKDEEKVVTSDDTSEKGVNDEVPIDEEKVHESEFDKTANGEGEQKEEDDGKTEGGEGEGVGEFGDPDKDDL